MREGVAYRCQSHALIIRSLKCELPTPVCCFANNGTVAGVKSTQQIITVLLSTTDDTNNTRQTSYFSQIIRP